MCTLRFERIQDFSILWKDYSNVTEIEDTAGHVECILQCREPDCGSGFES